MNTHLPTTVQYRNWTIGFAHSVWALEKQHRGSYEIRFRQPAHALLNDWGNSFDYFQKPLKMARHLARLQPGTKPHEDWGILLHSQKMQDRTRLGSRLLKLAGMRAEPSVSTVLAHAQWTADVMTIGAWWAHPTLKPEAEPVERYRHDLTDAVRSGHHLKMRQLCVSICRLGTDEALNFLADFYRLLARDNPLRLVMLDTIHSEKPERTHAWLKEVLADLTQWWDGLGAIDRLRAMGYYRQQRTRLQKYLGS